jgi:hypothetical protein
MSDFHERLVAADPAAGPSYAHHDPETMVSRIVAQYPVRRRNVLRAFQLKMAGAVTMATVLTVGGIAALDAAVPGLPILALASAHAKASTPDAVSPKGVGTFSSIMRVYEQYQFSAGTGLSANASTGNAYHLALPTSGSAEASRIASIFSVSGPPVDTNGDATYWTVTDPSGPSVSYDHYGGVPIWYYQSTSASVVSSPPSAGAAPGIEAVPARAMPSQAVVESDVKGYLSRLGYGYRVGSPQFSSSVGTTTGPDQVTTTTNWATVDYGILVDGTRTDQSVQFTFDASNQLVSASGPAFSVDAPVNYPLQSPVAGVAVLNAQQRSYFTSGVPSGTGDTVAPTGSGPVTQDTTNPSSGSSGSSTGPVPTPGPTDTSVATSPTGPPIIDVTLDSVDVSLQSYTLTDGSVWLLPIYTYTGNVAQSDGTSYHGSWSTIAVDPAFVQVAVVTNPILY